MLDDNSNQSANPTLEKFIQTLLTTKNIACHLMEDVRLNVNGKHIFEVLAKTKIHVHVRKLALQMVVAQMAYFPLKIEENAEESDEVFDIFDNFETKAIEHFCSQTLMAMSSNMFEMIKHINPEVLESDAEMQKAADIINNQLIDKFLVTGDSIIEDPTKELVIGIKNAMDQLTKRWPAHHNDITKMKRFLSKEFLKSAFVDKAIIHLSNMLAFLITKPELVFFYAPHLALNERLCVHLAENFEINKLNTKVIKLITNLLGNIRKIS